MYFDTHAHYYDPAYDADRDALLAGLPAAGVDFVVCPGCDLPTSCTSIALAEQYSHVYAAVGFHPENLEGARLGDLVEVERLARAHPKVRAIGEIGLDYYWEKDEGRRRVQQAFFSAQLELAQATALPAIVHDREAHGPCLSIVRDHPGATGVYHCYSGGLEDAKVLVQLGWMLSFTGAITFPNARRALEVLQWLPLEHLMLETDAPYMAPVPYRGKRNTSAYLSRMAETVAQVKGLTTAQVAQATTENGKRFFGIAP